MTAQCHIRQCCPFSSKEKSFFVCCKNVESFSFLGKIFLRWSILKLISVLFYGLAFYKYLHWFIYVQGNKHYIFKMQRKVENARINWKSRLGFKVKMPMFARSNFLMLWTMTSSPSSSFFFAFSLFSTSIY